MRRDLAVCVFLVLVTLAVYGQVVRHDFVNIDDDKYVYENRHVRSGLTADGVVWAFTTLWASNWHPLTWLSHMLDCEWFGLNAGYHHLVNVFLHILNSTLLFLILRRMTGAVWRSGMVAALFALHPLHVESVAWISERKDVLSTLFFLLTLWAYGGYARHPSWPRYGAVFGCLALGLMAKPMLVTVPFVLLLLDYWPLGRLPFQENMEPTGPGAIPPEMKTGRTSSVPALLAEKVPLFALAAASSLVTFVAQQRGGATSLTYTVPLSSRIANALVTYVAYMGKMFWPTHLAVLYPYRQTLTAGRWALAGLALAGISALVVWAARRRPYLPVGWFWYLGTLVPVIGLVQVGEQSMADRYTYVPLIGLFMMTVWGSADLAAGRRYRQIGLGVFAGMVLVGCVVGTWFQVRLWQSEVTLFQHALRVTRGSALAHNNLGLALSEQEEREAAIRHYREAIRIDPTYAKGHVNLAVALMEQGAPREAIRHAREAVRLRPHMAKAHLNLGFVLDRQGEQTQAAAHYQEALRIDPHYATAHYNLGGLLHRQGKLDQAAAHYGEALRIDPGYVEAYNNLGILRMQEGRLEEAVDNYQKALRLAPLNAETLYNLGVVLARQGDLDEAIFRFREAVRLDPGRSAFHTSLALALATRGGLEEAIDHYREAIRLNPEDPGPRNNLAWIESTHPNPEFRNGPEAVGLAERACESSQDGNPAFLDTLAAAYAEAGRFPEAVTTLAEAILQAESRGMEDFIRESTVRLEGYKAGRPYREPRMNRDHDEP